jgi:hypothetical protein
MSRVKDFFNGCCFLFFAIACGSGSNGYVLGRQETKSSYHGELWKNIEAKIGDAILHIVKVHR